MENTTIFLFKVIWFLFVTVWVSAVIGWKYFDKVIDDIVKSPALLYFWAIINLVLWFIMVNIHNNWDLTPSLIVTVVSWMVLIKWISLLFFPEMQMKILKSVRNNLCSCVYWWLTVVFWLICLYYWYIV